WADYLGVPVEKNVDLGKGIKIEMVLIPPGEFLMGSSDAERARWLKEATDAGDDWSIGRIPAEGPQHRVQITKPFYLAIHEVTQEQHQQITGANPSYFSSSGEGKDEVAGQRTNRHPVEDISWFDAIDFCNTLSASEQLQPSYTISGNSVMQVPGNGFRLPSEAEWEYACRAGSTGMFFFGEESKLGNYAWYMSNSKAKTHPVGEKQPNGFGAYDMHGNISEWCWDQFDKNYFKQFSGEDDVLDPLGPPTGSIRVRRGGAWRHQARHCRAALRHDNAPNIRVNYQGIRLAMTVEAANAQASTADPHRRAAEEVLRLGGSVRVWSPGAKSVARIEDLPRGRFALQSVGFVEKRELTVDSLEFLSTVEFLESANFPSTHISDESLRHLGRVTNLQQINLSYSQVTDAGVRHLSNLISLTDLTLGGNPGVTDASTDVIAGLEGLRRLRLNGMPITDAGLNALSDLPNLTALYLGHCEQISEIGLGHLQSLKFLQQLELHDTAIGDEAVAQIGQLKTLRFLDLRKTNVTESGAAQMEELLPMCAILHPSLEHKADRQAALWALENRGTVSAWGIGKLQTIPPTALAVQYIVFSGKTKPRTGSINLEGLHSIEGLRWPSLQEADQELAHIGKLTSLTQLDLGLSDVSAAGLKHLAPLSQLEILMLGHCIRLSDEALASLATLEQLRNLHLNSVPITDDGLSHLARRNSLRVLYLEGCKKISGQGMEHLSALPALRFLHVGNTAIDDAALLHLKRMKSLRILNIVGTNVSAAGAAQLQQALPGCVIFHESLNDVPWQSAAHPPADADRAAAEWVMSVGGSVYATSGNDQRTIINVQSKEMLPKERFKVFGVVFEDPMHAKEVTDNNVVNLKGLTGLNGLRLGHTEVTGRGISQLAPMPNIQEICMPHNFDEAELRSLSQLKGIKHVELWTPNYTNACIVHLNEIPGLEKLTLTNTAITDNGFHRLSARQLRAFRLEGNFELSDAAFEHLKNFPQLAEVTILGAPNVRILSDLGLAHLQDVKQLERLFLHNTKVTAAGVAALKQALPKCKVDWDGGVVGAWQPTVEQQSFFDAVAKLKPEEQIEAVRKQLKLANTDFDGKLKYKIQNGLVLELQFITDDVTDIWPVRALPHIQRFFCNGSAAGKGRLADLSPLQGIPILSLNCSNTRVADLSPLQRMQLGYLHCGNTQVADLSPLQEMPLKELFCPEAAARKNAPLLKKIKTLKTINSQPAAKFFTTK
ncbi:MAG: SUMF1/EgtB/PvdO family nonheme iron enzyme, partial [Planctomycetaceae bacterium]|nr:SUMF1/EgtB/PvdO family nonheme iron enzyme [Planctomycetaceae bacterium]